MLQAYFTYCWILWQTMVGLRGWFSVALSCCTDNFYKLDNNTGKSIMIIAGL